MHDMITLSREDRSSAPSTYNHDEALHQLSLCGVCPCLVAFASSSPWGMGWPIFKEDGMRKVWLLVLVLVALLVTVGSAGAQGGRPFSTTLSGAAEIGGGDPDGSG